MRATVNRPLSSLTPLRAPRCSVPSLVCKAEPQSVAGPPGAFEDGRKGEVRQTLFNNISSVYDTLNDRLSFGQHLVWKRMTVKWAGAEKGQRALDLCCGSGDLAFILGNAVGPSGSVVGLDFAQEMLDDAAVRQKTASSELQNRKRMAPMRWIQGDAMDLPFEDNTFDCASMGYGLRNVSDRPAALEELRRVLKPGSKAAILDFNNSQNTVVDSAQQLFLDQLVVPAAREYGLADEYAYLRPSILAYPTGPELEKLAIDVGYASAEYYEIAFGMMGVLVVQKSSF